MVIFRWKDLDNGIEINQFHFIFNYFQSELGEFKIHSFHTLEFQTLQLETSDLYII